MPHSPTARRTAFLFALQWLSAGIATAVATPVALGPLIGLDAAGTSAMVQRTLVLAGAATLIQTLAGHRMPIQEGPAGLWTGIILVLAGVATAAGASLDALRADLQLGMMAAGAVLALLGGLGLIRRLAALMTPLVTGTFLLLLSLQVSGPFLRGMAGGGGGSAGSLLTFLLSLATFAVVTACIYFGRGLTRSLAVLIGLATGWALFLLAGAGGIPRFAPAPLVRLPQWFAWGIPTPDTGIILVGLVTGVLGCINLFGAMAAMAQVTGSHPTPADHDRGGLAMGIIHLLSGAGATGGIIVLTHSAALVGLMGAGSLGALVWAGAGMAVLGLFPALADLFGALPAPVSYATLFALFAQVAGIGLQSLLRAISAQPELLGVAGISLMVGVGCMLLPAELLAALPPAGRYLISNGLITGTLAAMFLQGMARRVRKSTPAK